MIVICAVSAQLTSVSWVPSQEHVAVQPVLEPVPGFFSTHKREFEYLVRVRRTLLKSVGNYPSARMVVVPAFEPEFAVSIEPDGEETVAWSCTMTKQIWGSKDAEGLTAREASRPIPRKLANRIAVAWWSALSGVRFPERGPVGVDGTTYYFASFKRWLVSRAGQAWSPRSGPSADMVRVGTLLRQYVAAGLAGSERVLKELETATSELESSIRAAQIR